MSHNPANQPIDAGDYFGGGNVGAPVADEVGQKRFVQGDDVRLGGWRKFLPAVNASMGAIKSGAVDASPDW
jgi:hypothetical protein